MKQAWNFKDITGQRFGKLLVIKRVDNHVRDDRGQYAKWLCQCDCGNTKEIIGAYLRQGSITSCGCSHYIKQQNEITEKEDVVIIQVEDKEVIIDKEDYPKIFPHRVHIDSDGYARFMRKAIHRVVTNCPPNKVVDHINHNLLDNRKENLRVVSPSINCINRKPHSNTGEIGITYKKRAKRYYVALDRKYCGSAKTLEEAIKIRDKSINGTNAGKYNYYLQGKGE